MSYLESIPLAAGADLSASQYKAVVVGGTIAANALAMGIQQNKPDALGKDLTVGYLGRSRYVANAAIAAGALLTVTTSGYMSAVTSGQTCIGRAMTAVSSGETGEGVFNFAGGMSIA